MLINFVKAQNQRMHPVRVSNIRSRMAKRGGKNPSTIWTGSLLWIYVRELAMQMQPPSVSRTPLRLERH